MGLDDKADVPDLKPIIGLPPDRKVPQLDHVDIDVELHPLRPRSIEMLVKPKPGARLDLASLDQVHLLDVFTPQRVVARVRDKGKHLGGRSRDLRRH
jgi:hypothetical protein